VVWIGVTDGIGHLRNSLDGVAEQVFGPVEAKPLKIVVERYVVGRGEQGGDVGRIQVHGRGKIVEFDVMRVMLMDVIQHPPDQLLAVVAVEGMRVRLGKARPSLA
jgi:hypothetical protein